ncbi:related to oxidoreductase [Phialocephala subalpina]|uniref:Related to oxidoreductase n=1 Tax=Phialocephala subalpina TaxID=576137 RepID=A0A1L7WU39_9HELO|nr:related to oxidoreductase [Phialocephala subalpina]
MPTNKAAYLITNGQPLEVKEAPYTSPSPSQIVIKSHAVAINPVDWATQAMGHIIFPWIKLPTVIGSDVAGEVVELGTGVQKFNIGDRIVGQCLAFLHNNAAEGAFQEYVVLEESVTCKIPDSLSYENAAVLPLGLSTASCGLFQKDFLALDFPTLEPKPNGKWLLIWGGSTSVGCNAVQLATLAGYSVVSTSSPKNFELVKKLGAREVFDHNSPTAVEDIVKFLEGKEIVGAFAIGGPKTERNGFGAGENCLEIVKRSEGVKFVAMAMHGPAELAPEGVKAAFVTGGEFKSNEVGRMIYGEFLPKALAEGKYVCAPEALVVGKGLEKIEEAFAVQKKGVSAKKIVVSL